MKNKIITPIVNPPYFSNWADLIMPKIAYKILPFIVKIPFITPNTVSLVAFCIFLIACLLINIQISYHLFIAAFLLPISYIGDCLDGQLARTTNRSSKLGSYLDKMIDFLKVWIITFSASWYAYVHTQNVIYLILGSLAAFFFSFRYYIKYLVVLTEASNDKEYLTKSNIKIKELYITITEDRKNRSHTFYGNLLNFWYTHRAILFIEEAELIVFTSVALLFNRLDILVWVLAIGQICIVIFRLIERGCQLTKISEKLIEPVNK